MLVIFCDWQGIIHNKFVPEVETINAVYYKDVMERPLNRIRRVRLGMCDSGVPRNFFQGGFNKFS